MRLRSQLDDVMRRTTGTSAHIVPPLYFPNRCFVGLAERPAAMVAEDTHGRNVVHAIVELLSQPNSVVVKSGNAQNDGDAEVRLLSDASAVFNGRNSET